MYLLLLFSTFLPFLLHPPSPLPLAKAPPPLPSNSPSLDSSLPPHSQLASFDPVPVSSAQSSGVSRDGSVEGPSYLDGQKEDLMEDLPKLKGVRGKGVRIVMVKDDEF
eukprot:TRINITY_DN1357_c0_g5_i1.p1 TRINITY_DN1357_c0_g5~~TRINITY_DN1357_c0_g5_i1.p1  ORF type:complete len:124 (+),score=37.52 TRINITY_DN1357_c0_g5_i1:49-372(+)